MAVVFSFLFVFVMIVLLLSVFAPKKLASHSKKPINRKQSIPALALIALILLILVSVTSPKQIKSKSIDNDIKTSQSPVKPVITYKTSTKTKAIPFTSTTVQDSSMAKGSTKITTGGVNGIETITYKDTYTNGKLTSQTEVSDAVTTKPTEQITSVGTYAAPTTYSSTTAATGSSTSCYPLSDEGGCYEPGEYCSDADHDDSGIAGDGKSITCEDNDGWRWESS